MKLDDLTDNKAPRIPLPRTRPPAGKVHIAIKTKNAKGASVTLWGQVSDATARAIVALVVDEKDKRPGSSDSQH